ncbi:PEP-CTERM sorting domain-containing protein [Massilia sp. KIM]|uniref:PEP-CTERM sorting domain-containing protein n=1 Tax=Massilia sp. KIM TaxID=1955422 RepID=UPI00098F28CD|nr:PEP-CTERM sorting domain-containing protein [Massilia sp. KIM]
MKPALPVVPRLFPVICLILGAMFALPGAAQTSATLTTSGTMSLGYDGIGLFGAPDASLSGTEFTLSITLDLTRLSGTRTGGENWVGNNGYGNPMFATGALTVAGRTYSWLIDSGSAYAGLSSNRDAVGMDASGKNMLDGYNVGAGAFIQTDGTTPRVVLGTDFAQTLVFDDYTLTPLRDHALAFYATIPYIPCEGCPGASGPEVFSTWFQADNPRAVWTASPVPEPATWGMLVLGAGVVGLARRRPFLNA